jgi:osmotically-inducible protein OsmY
MRNEEEKRAESFDPPDLQQVRRSLEAAHRAGRKLESLIRDDLRKSSYHGMGRVSCAVSGTVLTLTGRVSSYYLKQVAQQIAADHTRGDFLIANQLQVEP